MFGFWGAWLVLGGLAPPSTTNLRLRFHHYGKLRLRPSITAPERFVLKVFDFTGCCSLCRNCKIESSSLSLGEKVKNSFLHPPHNPIHHRFLINFTFPRISAIVIYIHSLHTFGLLLLRLPSTRTSLTFLTV